jgi:hypothetical protein
MGISASAAALRAGGKGIAPLKYVFELLEVLKMAVWI